MIDAIVGCQEGSQRCNEQCEFTPTHLITVRMGVFPGLRFPSSAVNFVSAMEAQTNAIFVGEEAGAGPNHYGDPKRYILPRSKLWVPPATTSGGVPGSASRPWNQAFP